MPERPRMTAKMIQITPMMTIAGQMRPAQLKPPPPPPPSPGSGTVTGAFEQPLVVLLGPEAAEHDGTELVAVGDGEGPLAGVVADDRLDVPGVHANEDVDPVDAGLAGAGDGPVLEEPVFLLARLGA